MPVQNKRGNSFKRKRHGIITIIFNNTITVFCPLYPHYSLKTAQYVQFYIYMDAFTRCILNYYQ